MSRCPYCEGEAVLTTSERSRPDTHNLVQCVTCGLYAVAHAGGRVFQLFNPEDPESDAVVRRP